MFIFIISKVPLLLFNIKANECFVRSNISQVLFKSEDVSGKLQPSLEYLSHVVLLKIHEKPHLADIIQQYISSGVETPY